MGPLAVLKDAPALRILVVQQIDHLVRILSVVPYGRHPTDLRSSAGEHIEHRPGPTIFFPRFRKVGPCKGLRATRLSVPSHGFFNCPVASLKSKHRWPPRTQAPPRIGFANRKPRLHRQPGGLGVALDEGDECGQLLHARSHLAGSGTVAGALCDMLKRR